VSEFTVKVEGIKQVGAALDVLTMRFDAAAAKIAEGAGDIIAKHAKSTSIWRGETKNLPSPPRPTQRTGATRNSIRTRDVKREAFGEWSSNVRPTTEYARRLELGYPNGNKQLPVPGVKYGKGLQPTRPYPYLGPGFTSARDEVIEYYERTWREALEA